MLDKVQPPRNSTMHECHVSSPSPMSQLSATPHDNEWLYDESSRVQSFKVRQEITAECDGEDLFDAVVPNLS